MIFSSFVFNKNTILICSIKGNTFTKTIPIRQYCFFIASITNLNIINQYGTILTPLFFSKYKRIKNYFLSKKIKTIFKKTIYVCCIFILWGLIYFIFKYFVSIFNFIMNSLISIFYFITINSI